MIIEIVVVSLTLKSVMEILSKVVIFHKEKIYWKREVTMNFVLSLHQNLALVTFLLLLWRSLVASLGQWRGKPLWGHKFVAISANSLLDIQIVIGIIVAITVIGPSINHIIVVGLSAVLAHFSYSVEKRRGSSFITVAAAWGALVPLIFLLLK